MDDKNQKNKEDIKKRMDKLELSIDVPLGLDYMTILLKNKPPQYLARFAAWARTTLDKDEYMANLVQSCISKFATDSLIGDITHTEEFSRGQISGALFVYEEMERLSNINNSKKQS